MLTIFHQNIQCLGNKILNINNVFNEYSCDILLVTEHWQNESQINVNKLSDFTLVNSYCRKTLCHGGVAIYKSNSFSSDVSVLLMDDFCLDGVFEYTSVSLTELNMFIIVIYRPPNGDFNLFLELFDGLLERLSVKDKLLVIGGDFNVNFNSCSTNLALLSDLLGCYDITITIKIPTRITASSTTCIDNFLINSNVTNFKTDVINLYLSDHFSQAIYINTVFPKNKENKFLQRRNFCKENIVQFCNFLEREDWQEMYAQDCANKACKIFCDIVMFYFELCFPLKRVSLSKKIQRDNWMTDELRELKHRVTMFSDLAKMDQAYRNISILLQKQYCKALVIAKRNYHDRQIQEAPNKTKAMWNTINKIKGKSNKPNAITITENGKKIPDAIMANNFNKHFTSATSINSVFDPVFLSSNVPSFERSLFFKPVLFSDILSLINKLKSSNSCGYDNISNNLIKHSKVSICQPLAFLINLSFSTGNFPDIFKLAIVQPYYKKGDPNDYGNYRAISLLCSFSKLFELAIKDQLSTFLHQNALLSVYQHGFSKNKSTESALCEYQGLIVNALDNKQYALGLFIDFSRAFDVVDHEILLNKLYRYGVRGVALNLFSSYLNNRTQIVKVNYDITSAVCNITQGVPQGSVLGPLLFNIFANDLITYLNNIPNIHCVCYADDTNILITDKDLNVIKNSAELVYSQVVHWSEENRLKLNKNKTNMLLFTLHRNLDVSIFNGSDITFCNSVKMLGITFDRYLDWENHIDSLCNKLRSNCYGLRFMSLHCSRAVLMSLYYANFHSHLRYGITNWGNSTHINRVFILQKYAIRIIAGLGFRESCRTTFKNLKILTAAGVYILEVCIFVYKNQHRFLANQVNHNHNTRFKGLLQPQSHRTALYQRSFYYNGCKFFNALSEEIKLSPNLHVFKLKVKKILLEKNCYEVDDFFL